MEIEAATEPTIDDDALRGCIQSKKDLKHFIDEETYDALKISNVKCRSDKTAGTVTLTLTLGSDADIYDFNEEVCFNGIKTSKSNFGYFGCVGVTLPEPLPPLIFISEDDLIINQCARQFDILTENTCGSDFELEIYVTEFKTEDGDPVDDEDLKDKIDDHFDKHSEAPKFKKDHIEEMQDKDIYTVHVSFWGENCHGVEFETDAVFTIDDAPRDPEIKLFQDDMWVSASNKAGRPLRNEFEIIERSCTDDYEVSVSYSIEVNNEGSWDTVDPAAYEDAIIRFENFEDIWDKDFRVTIDVQLTNDVDTLSA